MSDEKGRPKVISEQLINTNINREVVANVEVKGRPQTVYGKLRGWSADHAKLFVELDRNYGVGMSEGRVIEVATAAAMMRARAERFSS